MSEWEKARRLALEAITDSRNIRSDDYRTDTFYAVLPEHEYALDAALSAFEREGFVLVPKVATIDMDRAGQDVTVMHSWGPGGEYVGEGSPADIWEAMIAAELKDRT